MPTRKRLIDLNWMPLDQALTLLMGLLFFVFSFLKDKTEQHALDMCLLLANPPHACTWLQETCLQLTYMNLQQNNKFVIAILQVIDHNFSTGTRL
jgi:hypothetical protein